MNFIMRMIGSEQLLLVDYLYVGLSFLPLLVFFCTICFYCKKAGLNSQQTTKFLLLTSLKILWHVFWLTILFAVITQDIYSKIANYCIAIVHFGLIPALFYLNIQRCNEEKAIFASKKDEIIVAISACLLSPYCLVFMMFLLLLSDSS